MNHAALLRLDLARLEAIAAGLELVATRENQRMAATLRDIAARLRGGGCKKCECENPGLGGTAGIVACRFCRCHH